MTTPSPSSLAQPTAELLDAFSAARNWRAIALTLLTLFVVVSLVGITGYVVARIGLMGLVFSAVTLVAGIIGYSAVGSQLLADAKGAAPSQSLRDSVLIGLGSAPRLIGAAFALIGLIVALIVVLAVALFICKVPVLGTALYAFVLPIGSVLLGLALFGAFNVSVAVLAPSIWDGHGVFTSVSRLLAVLRQRPLEVLIRLVLLGLLVGLSAAIIGAILMSGFSIVQTMAGTMRVGLGGIPGFGEMTPFSALGPYGQNYSSFGMTPPFGMFGAFWGNQPMGAGALVGSVILFAIGGTLPTVIFIKGLCIIYLRLMADLDLTASNAILADSIVKARETARQAKEQAASIQAAAREAAERARHRSVPQPGSSPTSRGESADSEHFGAAPSAVARSDEKPPSDYADPADTAHIITGSERNAQARSTPSEDEAQVWSSSTTPNASVVRHCRACGAPLRDMDLFCGKCGTRNA